MKTQNLLAMLAVCTMGCAPVLAQKDAPVKPAAKPADKAAQPAGDASEEAMMKAMEAASTPNENHKHMQQLAGTFDATVKWRMAPDAPWTESKATSVSSLMFEGRFLHTKFNGDMMGQPFTGMGAMGYNNLTKKYESTWLDSMSTGMMFMTGSYDAAKKAFTVSGQCADPMQGGKMKTMKIVTTIQSADKHADEFFEPGTDGKEFKSMEISYTRTAGAPATDTKAPGKTNSAK